jgi:hypothetical protein
MGKKPTSCTARILIVIISLLGLCLLLAGVSAWNNQNLPTEEDSATLGALDKARLAEALHLKAALGDTVWPGWGEEYMPVIVWNQAYEFLLSKEGEPPAGWSTVPGDDLNGQKYFRRKADDPQNFAVRLGDAWAASMATKRMTDVFLIRSFRDNFPVPLKQIFPYRFLLQPSETQIGGLLHETFHVLQYQNAPARMDEAESIHRLGEEYQASANAFRSEWKQESGLLAEALEAETQAEKADLVRQFLEIRDVRRTEYKLEKELVDYERWLEWEEGTAKYIEVAILRQAGETAGYEPLPGLENDPDFKKYRNSDQRWSQELVQLRYQTTSGESQFYMTGLAQAFLLDDLLPDWKVKYWEHGVFLEDLLHLAIGRD